MSPRDSPSYPHKCSVRSVSQRVDVRNSVHELEQGRQLSEHIDANDRAQESANNRIEVQETLVPASAGHTLVADEWQLIEAKTALELQRERLAELQQDLQAKDETVTGATARHGLLSVRSRTVLTLL